ncbi:MAG: TRAP transporter small permease [Oscillospiraceae bacterium]|nr:TRAP transporter small permease [Oscillospiraceae bacterium]
MKKVLKVVYRIEDVLVFLTVVAMVLVVCWSVLCRRVFMIPFLVGEELSRYLMIWGVFIGIAIGVRRKSHVGIRALVDVLPIGSQRVVDIIQLVITTVMYVVFGIVAFGMILKFMKTGQTSTMLRLPMSFVYTILPIGFWLSAIHSVQEIIQYVRDMRAPKEQEAAQ